jgi:ribonuclease P protein component
MDSRRLTARDRLRSGADFARVYQRRASSADGTLLVYVCDNALGRPRLGLSVSRKLGGAVERNRWKRILREAFRLSRTQLPSDLDIIVIPRPGSTPELARAKKSLVRLVERATRRLARGAAGQETSPEPME